MDDDTTVDQREEHRLNPNKPASLEVLQKLGVLYWAFDADTYKENPKFAVRCGRRGGTERGKESAGIGCACMHGWDAKIGEWSTHRWPCLSAASRRHGQ